MGRTINLETSGKNRTRLLRLVSAALRELMQQKNIDGNTRDIVAFISLALLEISKTIDSTVEPWEKRGYWLKADRFRMEWAWVENTAGSLYSALSTEDWQETARVTAGLAQRLSHVKLPAKHSLGNPWAGAWEKLSRLHSPEKQG